MTMEMHCKGIVKEIFNTHLQNLNGSLSKIKGLLKSNFAQWIYTLVDDENRPLANYYVLFSIDKRLEKKGHMG